MENKDDIPVLSLYISRASLLEVVQLRKNKTISQQQRCRRRYHLEWPFKKLRIKKGGKIKILSHLLVIIPTKEHDKPFQKSRCMPKESLTPQLAKGPQRVTSLKTLKLLMNHLRLTINVFLVSGIYPLPACL